MKESAPKRQKKKTASEGGELEYTPIRRRRTKNAGTVVLAEDEISVAYNDNIEASDAEAATELSLPSESDEIANEPSISEDGEALEGTAHSADETPAVAEDAEENNEAEQEEVLQLDAVEREELGQPSELSGVDVQAEAESVEDAPPSTAVAEEIETLPCDPRLERVVLPDEISLVGVLPLEEETEEEHEAPAEAETTDGAVIEEETPEAVEEDDEEFVFTPMPTPVVYERVVLPDEISLVDVFPEFNIPVVQESEPQEEGSENAADAEDSSVQSENESPATESEVASNADEASSDESEPKQDGDETPFAEGETDAVQVPLTTEKTTDIDEVSDGAENGEPATDGTQTPPSESEATADAVTEGDPLAAEFDFSDIDFDTLTPPTATVQEDESETQRADASEGDASLAEQASEHAEADSPREDMPEREEDEDAPVQNEGDGAVQSTDAIAAEGEEDGEESIDAAQAPADEAEQLTLTSESEGTERAAAEEGATAHSPDAPKKKKEKAKQEEQRSIENRFDIVELFAFTLALVFIITAFFFRSSTVKGSSMANTLHDGDQLILYSFLYEPEIGDIVVFEDYSTPYKEPLVKRVIATEGQTVMVLDPYTVLVDGVPLPQDYVFVDRHDDTHYPIRYTVSEGHLFVMGDHRNASSDSRAFGEVAKSAVLGKVILRYYPFADFKYFND